MGSWGPPHALFPTRNRCKLQLEPNRSLPIFSLIFSRSSLDEAKQSKASEQQCDRDRRASKMASDEELVSALRDFLRSSDLSTTTTAIVRRRLEQQFSVDLSDRKSFIREQVDLFLQSGELGNDQNDDNGSQDEVENKEDEEEEEEEDEEEEEEEEDEDDVAETTRSTRKRR